MLKKNPVRHLKNRKGLATLEIIPVMIVIALLINYSLGFFGIIHTGILNSIASRNYAFETFRNRTNILYFHDSPTRASGSQYSKFNTRMHGIASETRASTTGSADAIVTVRPIGFGQSPTVTASDQDHNPSGGDERGIFAIREKVRNQDVDSAPVWVRPVYGICLNAKCKQ